MRLSRIDMNFAKFNGTPEQIRFHSRVLNCPREDLIDLSEDQDESIVCFYNKESKTVDISTQDENVGILAPISCEHFFAAAPQLRHIEFSNFIASQTICMTGMFRYMDSLESVSFLCKTESTNLASVVCCSVLVASAYRQGRDGRLGVIEYVKFCGFLCAGSPSSVRNRGRHRCLACALQEARCHLFRRVADAVCRDASGNDRRTVSRCAGRLHIELGKPLDKIAVCVLDVRCIQHLNGAGRLHGGRHRCGKAAPFCADLRCAVIGINVNRSRSRCVVWDQIHQRKRNRPLRSGLHLCCNRTGLCAELISYRMRKGRRIAVHVNADFRAEIAHVLRMLRPGNQRRL